MRTLLFKTGFYIKKGAIIMGFEQLGKKLMRLGQDTKSGVQKMGESYQINSKISDAKKALDQYYRAIGEKVYQDNSETPLEGMEEEFAAVKEALDNITEYTEQLNKVKGVTYCPECGKEAARGEKFCSDCGAPLVPGAMFCAHCGKKVEAAPVCANCGRQLEAGQRFCPFCGTKV